MRVVCVVRMMRMVCVGGEDDEDGMYEGVRV